MIVRLFFARVFWNKFCDLRMELGWGSRWQPENESTDIRWNLPLYRFLRIRELHKQPLQTSLPCWGRVATLILAVQAKQLKSSASIGERNLRLILFRTQVNNPEQRSLLTELFKARKLFVSRRWPRSMPPCRCRASRWHACTSHSHSACWRLEIIPTKVTNRKTP